MINNNCIIVNSVRISCDYETAERCGAQGTFQVEEVILITDFGDIDVTNSIDQGKHYHSIGDVVVDLGFDGDIDIEEV